MAININTLTDSQLQALSRQLGIGPTAGQASPRGPVAPLPGLVRYGEAPFGGAEIPAAPTISPLGLTVGAPEVTVPTGVRQLVSQAFQPARQVALRKLRDAAQREADIRGQSITDTPIGQEYLRQVSELQSTLGGQEAQAVLGLIQPREALLQQQAVQQEQARQARFGLQAGDILNRARIQQLGGQFGETALQARTSLAQRFQQQSQAQQLAAQQFQEKLRQQAFVNRASLAGLAGDIGLGLGKIRSGQAGTTTTTTPSLLTRAQGIGQGLSGIGLGLSGVSFQDLLKRAS
jgi:hypothetical protein